MRNYKPAPTPQELHAYPDETLVPQRDVLAIIHISRTSFWRGVKEGRFPQPVKLGPRMNRWRIGDIRALVRGESA